MKNLKCENLLSLKKIVLRKRMLLRPNDKFQTLPNEGISLESRWPCLSAFSSSVDWDQEEDGSYLESDINEGKKNYE